MVYLKRKFPTVQGSLLLAPIDQAFYMTNLTTYDIIYNESNPLSAFPQTNPVFLSQA